MSAATMSVSAASRPARWRRVAAHLGAVALLGSGVAVGTGSAAMAAVPTYLQTLGGPSQAAMYPSGLEFDPGRDRLVVADTGRDRVLFYSRTGTRLGGFGSHGTANGQFISPRDVAIDRVGNIYVADAENNRVQSFTAGGAWRWTRGGIGACEACLNTPIGLSFDTTNNVLLVASTGQSLVKAFDPAGTVRWRSPTGTELGAHSMRDVIRGRDGRIWLSAYKEHQIKAYNVTPAGVWTARPAIVLGDGTPSASGDNQLNFPYNVAFSPDGAIAYVSDTGNGRVARYRISGTTATWLPQFGRRCDAHPQPCPDPPASRGEFNHLRRATVDGAGNVYAADFWGNGIEVFRPDGSVLRQIEGASAPAPGFAEAFSVDQAADGTTYAMDRLNHRIERFSPTGTFLDAAGARGTQPGTFSWPEAVAVGPDGSVWATDTRGDRIQRWPANLATRPAIPSFGSTGAGRGQFNYPEGLDVAGDGKVFVADTRNHRIQIFNPATGAFTTFGGLGSGNGQFREPRGVAVTANAVYVADSLNNRVQKLSLSGAFLASYATGLNTPEGVAVAGDGTVWVADTRNNRVVHLSATLANLGDGFGSAGTGNLQFNQPHDLSVSGTKLYVADTYNNRVQVFRL
jgi:DNA-binding beta-propeller fold protein YncE